MNIDFPGHIRSFTAVRVFLIEVQKGLGIEGDPVRTQMEWWTEDGKRLRVEDVCLDGPDDEFMRQRAHAVRVLNWSAAENSYQRAMEAAMERRDKESKAQAEFTPREP